MEIYNEYNKILDIFTENLIKIDKKPPTFMEIAGYPHFENVCSNILQFFFDTNKEHNMGDMCIKALLKVAGKDVDGEIFQSIQVDREVTTNKKNRIDIIIETDSYVIGIENKVFSGLNNDLDDYEETVKSIAGRNSREAVCILLSLYDMNTSLGHPSFINITYKKFFDAVKGLMGEYSLNSNQKYLIDFIDFINTLTNLESGYIMDKKSLEFFHGNEKTIIQLNEEYNKVRSTMRDVIKSLAELISIREGVKQNFWRNPKYIVDVLYHNIETDKRTLTIDCEYHLDEWEINIFIRGQKDCTELQNWLNTMEITTEYNASTQRLIYKKYKYDTKIEELALVINDLMKKIMG